MGWLEPFHENPKEPLVLKGLYNDQSLQIDGKISLRMRLGSQVKRVEFFTCKSMTDEICIMGQTVTSLFPYDYRWDTRAIVSRISGEVLPCYYKGKLEPRNFTPEFERRVAPKNYTILEPNKGTFVELDLSLLPINGVYLLESENNTLEITQAIAPRILAQRTDVYHTIHTGDCQPINLRVRRFNLRDKPLLKEKVDEMLQLGIIEPSNSPWSARALIVQRRDGTARFCVDYRSLNAITGKDSFPIPDINETLEHLRGSKFFTTIDLQAGVWQAQMTPEDRDKTGFSCEEGHFRYVKAPYGLQNAPSTFSRMMKIVLSELLGPTCLAFVDEIVVHSDTYDQHVLDVVKVLERLDKSGLKVHGSKCVFATRELEAFGHTVTEEGIALSPKGTAAISDMRLPSNLSELVTVLGLFSYYRRFVQDYGIISAPLYRLLITQGGDQMTKSLKTLDLTQHPEALEAFEILKQALTVPPVLAFPKLGCTFRIYCDASSVGMGAILSQVDEEGAEHVIEYASKKFDETERRYSTTERECYAVVWSLRRFRHIIAYDEIVVFTDHSALTAFANATRETEAIPVVEYAFLVGYTR